MFRRAFYWFLQIVWLVLRFTGRLWKALHLYIIWQSRKIRDCACLFLKPVATFERILKCVGLPIFQKNCFTQRKV